MLKVWVVKVDSFFLSFSFSFLFSFLFSCSFVFLSLKIEILGEST